MSYRYVLGLPEDPDRQRDFITRKWMALVPRFTLGIIHIIAIMLAILRLQESMTAQEMAAFQAEITYHLGGFTITPFDFVAWVVSLWMLYPAIQMVLTVALSYPNSEGEDE